MEAATIRDNGLFISSDEVTELHNESLIIAKLLCKIAEQSTLDMELGEQIKKVDVDFIHIIRSMKRVADVIGNLQARVN